MLNKNRGKERRYKHGVVSASDHGVRADKKPGTSTHYMCAPSLDKVASTLSLVQFADKIGTQMLQDVMDCKSCYYAAKMALRADLAQQSQLWPRKCYSH